MMAAAPAERTPLVGPIFFWELVRHSRKGRGYLTRVGYAFALLAALYLMLGGGDITQKNAAHLSESAVFGYLVVQYAAVVLLTPIFVAGAFIEDRQQRTLELLLTTFLSAREIVLGKLCGRLIYVMAALLAGLPVLALLQLLGGVDITYLAVHSFLALVLMLICGGYAIDASMECHTVGGAILMTYTLLIGGFVFASILALPLTLFLTLRSYFTGTALIWWVLSLTINLLFAWFVLYRVMHKLRDPNKDLDYPRRSFDPVTKHKVVVIDTPTSRQVKVVPLEAAPPRERIHRAVRWKRLPPVWDRPLLWKETWFPPSELNSILAGVCCGVPLMAFLISLVTHGTFREFRPFVSWCCESVMALLLVLTTMRAAGSFGQERVQQTLLSLLSVPCSRISLIAQVALGSLLRYYAFAIGVGLLILAVGIYSPLFLVINLPLYLGQLVFFTMLGVWLSLTRLTPFQARFTVASYFFVSYFVLPLFFRHATEGSGAFWIAVLCPYFTWYLPDALGLTFRNVMPVLFLFTTMLTLLLIGLTERRFQRLQERL